jgi:ketosteroid isomerase-like protein
MSQENVEIVNRAIDAFNERDVGAFEDLVTPDLAWLPVTPEGDLYRGRDAIERYFAGAGDAWEEVRVVAEEYRDLGDRVLILGRFEALGKGSGIPVSTPQATIFDLLHGRISQIRSYLDQDDARRAAVLEA